MAGISGIVDIGVDQGERFEYRVAPEKLISGDPVQTLTQGFTSPCGQFSTGVWASTPGHWRVNYTEMEYCEILKGVSVIRDEAGKEKVLREGDRFVIPAGFKGTWEVVEPCEKIYVVYENETART
ncbi:cupin domain-containing protein [Paraburkholderia adhaesiva]|uniref:cupin domain-containing protein n=1 Tax=Paraburkholderia adhaesiva TaxID=2883244 RepID=UPI001F30E171|nr:cupin domain-containing protein [Paraburkholderia adhaesiva]